MPVIDYYVDWHMVVLELLLYYLKYLKNEFKGFLEQCVFQRHSMYKIN